MANPRILLITYYWPPSGGSPVLRWFKFSKHLPQLGIEPIVYTVSNGEYPSYDHTLAQQADPNLTVLREPIWEPYTWYKQFLGLKKEAKIQKFEEFDRNRQKLSLFLQEQRFELI